MKMTPTTVITGSLLILAAVVFVVVILPYAHTNKTTPSEIFRPRTPEEAAGRNIYIANGCVYCHSQSIRAIDWGLGAERIAQAGDYVADKPILFGSQRTGPDLSQEGGEHPDDWHLAHFVNPRFTRPLSIMPAFDFLGKPKIETITRYVQSLGMKSADYRMKRQNYWKELAVNAYEAGPDENVKWIHHMVPKGWRTIPNPYPTTEAGLTSATFSRLSDIATEESDDANEGDENGDRHPHCFRGLMGMVPMVLHLLDVVALVTEERDLDVSNAIEEGHRSTYGSHSQ